MQFDLRPFQPTDRPKLREIYLQARTLAFTWDSTGRYQLEDFDQATQGEVIWVAALGNRPVGYISWFLSDNFIHHLFVDPHFTRRGIGTALLHKRLSAIGRPASLKCIQRNIEAIAFYQSQGWQIMSSGTSTEGKYYLMVFLEDS